MQKYLASLLFFIVGLFILTLAVVFAQSPELLLGDLMQSREEIIINNPQDGDLFLSGKHIEVNGSVDGDVVVVGESITLNGPISGSVVLVGKNIQLTSVIERNAYILGRNVTITPESIIKHRLYTGGQDVAINGTVESRTYVQALAHVVLGGSFNDTLFLYTQKYDFKETAHVSGDAVILSQQKLDNPEQYITGTVHYEEVPQETHRILGWLILPRFTIIDFLVTLFSLLVLGLVIITLWPQVILKNYQTLRKTAGKTFFKGFLGYLVIPLLMILLFISIIGTSLAFLLGLILIVTSIMSSALFSIFFGCWLYEAWIIKKSLAPAEITSLKKSLFIGVPVFVILSFIPGINILMHIIAFGIGAGSFFTIVRSTMEV